MSLFCSFDAFLRTSDLGGPAFAKLAAIIRGANRAPDWVLEQMKLCLETAGSSLENVLTRGLG
jgi:hypothetical protein